MRHCYWMCLTADRTLFMRVDQVEAAWSLITPVLEAWESVPPTNFPNYPPAPGVLKRLQH